MKKVSELNREELKKVFENNSAIQELVREKCLDDATCIVSEYLSGIPRICDYSIGNYRSNNYFKIPKLAIGNYSYYEFLNYCRNLSESYCFNIDNKEINKAEDLTRVYLTKYLSVKNSDRVYNRLEQLNSKFCDEIFNYMQGEFDACNDSEYQLECFLDFSDDFLNDKMYIDDSFKLYENIVYTKCYT